MSLSHFEWCIVLYLSFLLLLRGDLLTAIYSIHLFVFGFISPLSFTHTYLNSAIWIVLISMGIRFIIQTPLICQTTPQDSGIWELHLSPYCDTKFIPDQFQPLFIYSMYKTDSIYISSFIPFILFLHQNAPPRGSSLIWDFILLLLLFSYKLFLSVRVFISSHSIDQRNSFSQPPI